MRLKVVSVAYSYDIENDEIVTRQRLVRVSDDEPGHLQYQIGDRENSRIIEIHQVVIYSPNEFERMRALWGSSVEVALAGGEHP